jgi:putative DNA primase/helicase
MRNLQYLTKLAIGKLDQNELREQIKTLLLQKERDSATELLATVFKENYRIYSIRNDDTKEVWIYRDGIYVPNGVTAISEYVRQIMGSLYTTHFANVIINKIIADTGIDHEDFFVYDAEPDYIPVLNGLFNLKTGKLYDFDEDKKFFSKFDIIYNPKADCPKIKAFLRDVLSCENDFQTIQEMFGWLFYKTYKFEKSFMLLGNGRNGKSKLIELVKRFVGAINTTNIQPIALENPESFTLGNLFGKIANLSPDIEPTGLRHTSVLKMATGNDMLTAQRKFKTPICFVNASKMIFGANDLPISYDTKSAFWQRWILIEFPFEFIYEDDYNAKNEDKRFYNKLRDDEKIEQITTIDEMSGLFNFAYEGYLRLERNKKFSYRYSPEEVRSIWIRKSNSFAAFFNDYLEVDYNFKMKKRELKKVYVEYCKEYKLRIMSDKMIKIQLENEGVQDSRIQSSGIDEYVWESLKFNESFHSEDNILSLSSYKSPSLIEKMAFFIEKNPENNLLKVQDFFGKEKLDKLLREGVLLENPKGTLRMVV